MVGDLNGKNKIHQSKFKAISPSLKLPEQRLSNLGTQLRAALTVAQVQ